MMTATQSMTTLATLTQQGPRSVIQASTAQLIACYLPRAAAHQQEALQIVTQLLAS